MYIQIHCEVIYICFISVITCHSPDNDANSHIASQTGDVVNDVIHYNCNYGYHLTSGNLIRTCQINGTWDGSLPMCSRKYCSKPCSPYCNRENTFEWSVITKLPNSEQSYKGKVKTPNYINRQNQSTTGKLWKP